MRNRPEPDGPPGGRRSSPRPPTRLWTACRAQLTRLDRAGGGLTVDVAGYGLATAFAWATAAGSTLPAHRAWGGVATAGYAAAASIAVIQRAAWPAGGRRPRTARLIGPAARAAVTAAAWVAVALSPMLLLVAHRSAGESGRAQEEVPVIEAAGQRLLTAGTPYLDRDAIAALAEPDRLLGYAPYQPVMALFGLPRALDAHLAWWSDARVWFAVVTAVALAAAAVVARHAGAPPAPLLRAMQAATVFPVCALTLATSGDDLPVLALCLLAIAWAASGRLGWAGVAVGVAASAKLFAWPVAFVLAVLAANRGRTVGIRYTVGAVGIPLGTALPVFAVGPSAMFENVLAFPLGQGLVASPARSPLPGHLIATLMPGGHAVAAVLLLLAGATIGVALLRRRPDSATSAALFAGSGLLVAILLSPSTRFGYLLYPVALLAWAAALRDVGTARPEQATMDAMPHGRAGRSR